MSVIFELLDLLLHSIVIRFYASFKHLSEARYACIILHLQDICLDFLLVLLKEYFGRMLKLLQLHIGPADDVDCLHEAFHAFPHVRDGILELVLELGGE